MTPPFTLKLMITKFEKSMNKELEFEFELEKLHNSLCINRLSLNTTKTNFVIFHSINKPKVPVTILINEEAIDEVKLENYLGVLLC